MKGRKNHRRDGLPAEGYEGAGQGQFFPDTTSGGDSTLGLPQRERERIIFV